jgi:hypothetical protein
MTYHLLLTTYYSPLTTYHLLLTTPLQEFYEGLRRTGGKNKQAAAFDRVGRRAGSAEVKFNEVLSMASAVPSMASAVPSIASVVPNMASLACNATGATCGTHAADATRHVPRMPRVPRWSTPILLSNYCRPRRW